MNKFIICGQPRAGKTTVLNAIRDSGINACQFEPFWIESRTKINVSCSYYDHVAFSSSVLNQFDGFEIVLGHTQQLQEICNANNAGLIAVRRRDLYVHIASYIMLLVGWAGGRNRNLCWNEDLIKKIPFFNHHIDKIIYNNWLIDNVIPTYKTYALTIEYENMSDSSDLLSTYLGKRIELVNHPPADLSHYFTNPDNFISDIDQRLEQLHAQK